MSGHQPEERLPEQFGVSFLREEPLQIEGPGLSRIPKKPLWPLIEGVWGEGESRCRAWVYVGPGF